MRAKARHLASERPDWWFAALAALAWLALIVQAALGPAPGAMAATSHHAGHAAGGEDPASAATALAAWSVMVVAMMLPLARADARWLAHRSLPRRRFRTVALHAVGFLAPWIAVGGIVIAIDRIASLGGLAVAAGLGVAAIWQVTPARRRAMTRCGAGRLPRIAGPGADVDCLASGARTGVACLVACGPAMLPMAIVHNLVLMLGVAALAATERRRGPNPERRIGRPAEAIGLAVLALATLGVAGLQLSLPT
jgi:predicted metal-binding membrane protein